MTAKILVVDDSLVMRRQVKQLLGAGGFETVEAADGLEAFSRLREHPDVCLVVCDVSMPRMGGLEFLDCLRALGSGIAVFMLTTEAQPELVARAERLGAVGWLTKPVKPDLLMRISAHLARRGAAMVQ